MDRDLPLGGDNEDLPRTLRREKEAREREARERERRSQSSFGVPEPVAYPPAVAETVLADDAHPAVVRRFDVPFGHLVVFFLKAAVAAIPAMVLLTIIAWGGGQILKAVAPQWRLFEIKVTPVGDVRPQSNLPTLTGAPAAKSKG